MIALLGLAAGCGDNTPATKSDAGSGGTAGGDAGVDHAGSDAGDASADHAGSDAGDASVDHTGSDASAGHTGSDAGAGVGGHGGSGGSGGSAGTGGNAGTGGSPDASVDHVVIIPCYTTSFTAPPSGATLTVADDTDHSCVNGFQYSVAINSGAPDGTQVQLFDGTSLLGTVAVSVGKATFAVQLPSSGTTQLSIQYPTTAACAVEENVTVSCPNSPPTCNISAPTISATHPDLNGVPTPTGDRSSSSGSAYQATFVVNTNAEDGQPITLAVDNAATPTTITTLSATSAGGSATFGVTLAPDGTYEVIATCKNLEGATGTSTKSTFPVDTTPPDLTVNSPQSGQFFGPVNLTNGAFKVCAQTDSTDAAGLSSSLGAAQNNLCVSQGGSSQSCVAVSAINTSTCVSIPCPGGAPFSLGITLSDAAGNPTTQTVTGVSCASTLPSVQIISPLSDSGTFSDQSKHILSATAPVGVHDLDPATPGAQVNVVACTDTAGAAALFVGQQGGTLNQLGTSVAAVPAVPADNCPSGLGFVARFPGVTLPDSAENGDGTLALATEVKVTITSAVNTSDVGTSPADDVWIDTIPPGLSLTAPMGLCGSFTQSASTVDEDVLFTADDDLVTVQVQNGASTTTYDTPAFIGGIATFSNVAFSAGQNNVSATEDDPAGNETDMTPVPCAVTIGSAPVVTFTTPVPNAILCPATATDTDCIDDTDPATPGWQGNLTVHVTANLGAVVGSTITFTVTVTGTTTTLGTGVTDATGDAQLNGITLPDGLDTVTATTDSVPNAGVGSGTVNVTVDTNAPDAPTGLTALVLDRRKTSMQLTWTAPADSNGNSVSGYEIRYAKVPVTATNFDNAAVTTVVPYSGVPASPGQLDGLTVSPLYIENGYYFGVVATDIAGTRSAILASPSGGACTCAGQCCAAHFNVTTIPSTSGTNEELGYSLDGSGDLNGDGRSDVIAGTFEGHAAYLYLGTTPTFAPLVASTVFSGTSPGFGNGVAAIGDVDKDGFEDLAIADFDAFNASSTGKIYVYKGRASWPATLTDTQADYVITPDASYAATNFGLSIARLGDFDGDGVDDFAVGASAYATRHGRVLIVRGKAGGIGNITLPDTANTIVIDGDATLTRPIFGYRVLGLGHFYSVTAGTTLIVSAPGTSNGTNPDNQGRVYAFHGQSGTAGAISIGSADAEIIGPGKPARIGIDLANLGPIVNSIPSVGIGNPADALSVPGIKGTMFITSGGNATGPFSTKIVATQSGTNGAGQVIFGGGISGRNSSFSLIGSSTPDIAIVAGSGTSQIAIVDGAALGGASSVDFTATAQVFAPLPNGWPSTAEAGGGLIPDINGDGYPDFAVSDSFSAGPGEVVVYW